jgi:hypothetical protein
MLASLQMGQDAGLDGPPTVLSRPVTIVASYHAPTVSKQCSENRGLSTVGGNTYAARSPSERIQRP